ncbi:MAG: hypothetical protein ABI880_09810, partial [Acidobacteriota bacterium]
MTTAPLIFALVAALVGARCARGQAGLPADLAITSATVVDVQSGTVQPDRAIVITGGEIVAVADSPRALRRRRRSSPRRGTWR